jgi:hypothetical protein
MFKTSDAGAKAVTGAVSGTARSQCGANGSCKPVCGFTPPGAGFCTYDDDTSWKVGTNPTHYGDPKGGCKSDEQKIQIDGLDGSVCAFQGCDQTACPTDVPAGVMGTPRCSISPKGSTTATQCALDCTAAFTPCCDSTGTKVAQDECDSWIDMFDKNGGTDWAECSDARENPCDCSLVTCSTADEVNHITEM